MKRVKYLIFLLPAIILLFVLPRLSYSAYSDSKVFQATKDTYANQAYPNDPKGSVGSVTLSNKYTTRLGYVQFENISLPEGAILDQAVFKFYVHEVHYAPTAKLNVGPVTGDWAENTLTWNNKPTIDQTLAAEAQIELTAGWKEIPITNLAHKWRDGSLANKGIFIYPYGFLYASPETEYAFSFKSRESGENPAKLEVVYHFEPSPSPSPTPSPSPSPEPEISPTPEVIEEAEEEETPSPTPEESPSPSPEAEERGLILGIFSLGQAIIGGLIILALIGAGIAFAAYARRKPKKKPKKGKPIEEEEESKEEEE